MNNDYDQNKNTIKAGGSNKRAQNVWVVDWMGDWMDGYPLIDCYDYQSTFVANNNNLT